MGAIQFRTVKEPDRGKIRGILKEAYSSLKTQSFADSSWWREIDGHEDFVFEDPEAFRHTWFAMRDGVEVGFASYDPKFAKGTAFINTVCVHPEHQRKGVGKQLLQFLIQQ